MTITIEKDENETTALYLTEGVAVTVDDLLEGVSAADEQGNEVNVTLDDLGGLDLSDPQYQLAPYIVTYAASHPISSETFTATREVYVIGMALRTSEPNNYEFDISEGDIIIESSGSNNLKVTYGSTSPQATTREFPNTEQITIISTGTASNKVIVDNNVTAKISLKDVDITNANVSPFQLLGTAKVELTLSGENTLTCTYNITTNNPGAYAGLYVPTSAAITIAAETDEKADSLIAKGGYLGAGIGGSYIDDNDYDYPYNGAGSITINSATISANGGTYAAGIGGGWGGDGGTVNISGGTIDAQGGHGGAGIGGGYLGAGGTVNISGGEITAKGGEYGAGIGGGEYGDGGTINISGGTVSATKGSSANDIGYGYDGSAGTIKITGGSVNVTSVTPQPTNGSYDVYLNTLTVGDPAVANTLVTAASVTNLGYTYSIKDVYTDAYGIVYFWLPMTGSNGTVEETVSIEANSKLYAAAYVRNSSSQSEILTEGAISAGDIVITQYDGYYNVQIGSILDETYDYIVPLTITGSSSSNIVTVSAGGTFNSGSAVQITLQGVTISNADESPFQLGDNTVVELTLSGEITLTCTNPNYSPGTYAGLYVASSAAITIAATNDDDSLTASGGVYGAGIGGGYKGDGGTINISGGTIKAYSNDDGAGIGGGEDGAGGTIEISGGTIVATGGSSAPNDIGNVKMGSGGTIKITGGSVNPTNGKVSPQPTNGSDDVFLNTLTVGSSANANTAITASSVDGVPMDTDPDALNGYGINDVYTDDSVIVYFWLTETADNKLVTVAADITYGAYFARSSGNDTEEKLILPFTVSFDTDDGSSIAAQSIYYNGKVSDVTNPTKYGYSFAGWYSDSVCTTEYDFNSTVTCDVTLYAKWAEKYSISYELNGGTNDSSNPTSYTYGIGVSSFADAARSGYTFNGWYDESGTRVTSISATATGDITLYAQWSSLSGGDSGNIYRITYSDNGGSGGTTVKEYGNGHYILSQDKANLTRSGYSFSGWNTKADGSGASYSTGGLITLSGDITLYAQWTKDGSASSSSDTTNTDNADTDTDTEPDTTDDTDTNTTDNTTNNSYIGGYEDGTFKPDGKVTRAEVAQMLYNIIGANDSGQGSEFSDVFNNNWYYAPVTYLTDEGIINGYEDGTFKPNSNITRAEFITLVVKYAGLTLKDSTSFSDVSESHWAYQYIAAAQQAGYVGGYEDGTFRPDSELSRAEAVTILNAMLGRTVEEETLSDITIPFSDVPKKHWAYYQILAAVEHEQE